MPIDSTGREPNEPFCGACGYSLVGLVDSTRCPECGRPIVEVLQREGMGTPGKRYTSAAQIFGIPLVQIASGPHGNERIGRARAIIAIGDIATGFVAIGGHSRGVIALGGFAIGIVANGGLAVGLVTLGGMAIGGVALGGVAVGIVAMGGLAAGVYTLGANSAGLHVIGSGVAAPAALRFFDSIDPWGLQLSSSGGGVLPSAILQSVLLSAGALMAALSAMLAVLALVAQVRKRDRPPVR